MDQRFRQHERLKSRKLINELFQNGESLKIFPLVAIFNSGYDFEGIKVGFSVPRRKFKKAVERNSLKRKMREAYRITRPLSKATELNGVALMLIYIGNTKPEYDKLRSAANQLLDNLAYRVKASDNQ